MKQSKFATSLVAMIAIAAISAPAITIAEESALKGRSVKVAYAEVNLDCPNCVRALYRRLQQASKRVCDEHTIGYNGVASVRALSDANRCYRQALAAAVMEIDNEILTKIHEG